MTNPGPSPWTRRRCNSQECAALIIWARTPNGKSTPVDAEPNPAGTWVLLPDPAGGHTPFAALAVDGPPDAERHMTHWATCKRAGQFGRRRTQ